MQISAIAVTERHMAFSKTIIVAKFTEAYQRYLVTCEL